MFFLNIYISVDPIIIFYIQNIKNLLYFMSNEDNSFCYTPIMSDSNFINFIITYNKFCIYSQTISFSLASILLLFYKIKRN